MYVINLIVMFVFIKYWLILCFSIFADGKVKGSK